MKPFHSTAITMKAMPMRLMLKNWTKATASSFYIANSQGFMEQLNPDGVENAHMKTKEILYIACKVQKYKNTEYGEYGTFREVIWLLLLRQRQNSAFFSAKLVNKRFDNFFRSFSEL